MGGCECTTEDKVYEWNELRNASMVKSRISGDNMQQNSLQNSFALGQSKRLAESMVISRMHKMSSVEDKRIHNENVKARIQNLHETQASKVRNIFASELQMYIQSLKAKFVGEIYDGKPNGFGKLYFDNDDYLEGNFIDGRCEGNGRFIKRDGSYYDGDLKNNVANGYGLYVGKNGFKYQGQWKNNMPNGAGEANYPNGSRYVGQFLNNKRHGKGTLYEGGNIYRGDFKNDKFDGILRFEGQNGEIYQGEWKGNKKNGQGYYEWPDGSSYKGHYQDDQRHGHGTLKYPTGEVYNGEWQNGVKHGRGTVESLTQNFTGIWKNGNLTEVI